VADRMLIIARTTPFDKVSNPNDGLTLFLTKLDRRHVQVREIARMGRSAVDANELFIEGLPVPEEDRIGEEGKGLRYVFDSMNPERIVVAAEAVGIGRAAIRRAAQYAKERVVFGRPIGQNQGVQHPLARCWMELEAANLMAYRAAELFDRGESCGLAANSAKYLAAEAGFEACQTAMMSMGGMGYAQEYHVERYLREVMIPRIAPVSPHQIMNFIAERVLELPKSY
jgi:acyl-CoA dehydrogenase